MYIFLFICFRNSIIHKKNWYGFDLRNGYQYELKYILQQIQARCTSTVFIFSSSEPKNEVNFVRCLSSVSPQYTFNFLAQLSFFDRLFLCRSVQFQTNLRTNEDTRSFQRGPNSENTLTKFKKLPQNHWAKISTKLSSKHPLVKGNRFLFR